MGIIEKRLRIETEQDSCTLRLPKELAPASGEVIVRKEGERLIIEPAGPKGLLTALRKMEPLEISFPDVDEDLPPLDEHSSARL